MIKDVKYLGGYRLKVTIHDGTEKVIDLESFLRSSSRPSVRKYLNKKLFAKVRIVYGAPSWGDNEMDINPINIIRDKYTVKEPALAGVIY